MIKAVIFDCFGVLVGRGFDATYRAAGGDPATDQDFIEDLLGQASLGLISHESFHKTFAEKLHIPVEKWQQVVQQAEQPDYELLAYIEDLHNTFKTAILSNANIGSIERRISGEWIKRCFDAMIVSGEVGIVKPDPEIYWLAAEKLQVPPAECIFLDDHQEYLAGAETTGMRTILYRDFVQAKRDLKTMLGGR
jgi:epoxide hydrolase-like predicted phosphatase